MDGATGVDEAIGEAGVIMGVAEVTVTPPTAQPPNTARLVNPISATAITRRVRVVRKRGFIVFSVKMVVMARLRQIRGGVADVGPLKRRLLALRRDWHTFCGVSCGDDHIHIRTLGRIDEACKRIDRDP